MGVCIHTNGKNETMVYPEKYPPIYYVQSSDNCLVHFLFPVHLCMTGSETVECYHILQEEDQECRLNYVKEACLRIFFRNCDVANKEKNKLPYFGYR